MFSALADAAAIASMCTLRCVASQRPTEKSLYIVWPALRDAVFWLRACRHAKRNSTTPRWCSTLPLTKALRKPTTELRG